MMSKRPTHRQGDIRGMCQYPMALLAERTPASVTGGELKFGKGSQSWTLVGSVRHGLPNSLDMEVYIAQLTVSRRLGYPKENPFTRRELLDIMQWPQKARYRERLLLAFERWFDTTIKERGVITWADQPEGVRGERWIRFLDTINWSDDPEGPCSFVWHDFMMEVIRAHDFVQLDPAVYFSLKVPLSKAIYRLQCGRLFTPGKRYPESLIPFAQQRLGLLGQDYPSQIKRKLAAALKELEALGMGWEYEPGKEGQELIVFTAQQPAQRAQPVATPPSPPIPTLQPPPTPRARLKALLNDDDKEETWEEYNARIAARQQD